MIENMVRNLPPSAKHPKVIFELGVFDGAQSVEMAKAFPSAKIYSFDCSPRCAPDIRAAIAGYPNITFTEVAVGDKDCDIGFKMCKGAEKMQKGSGSLLPLEVAWSPGWEQIDVPVHVTRMDTWAAQNNVTAVDLIWSDLQGFDYEAFLGMGTLMDTVKAVYAEVMYSPIYKGQKLFKDVDALLTSKGFKLKHNWPLPPPHVFGDALWLRA